MKKIVSVLVSVCLMFTLMAHNTYALNFDPGEYDFILCTTDFVSAYIGGVLQDTVFENDKDLNEINGLELTYSDNEYTLNVTDTVELTASKEFLQYQTYLFGIYFSNVNIVGNGQLILNVATNDFDDGTETKCIDAFIADLNIGSSDSENGPSIIINDISNSSKKLKTIGIDLFRSNLSIINAGISISTSEYGIRTNSTSDQLININNSGVEITCKNNSTANDYYAIYNDVYNDSYYNYDFKDSIFYFYNDTNQEMHCIGTNQKLILDGCRVIANEGKFNDLFKIGDKFYNDMTCIKIVDSHIETICIDDCIISGGKGDLYIEDSYIDVCSLFSSPISTTNHINIKYTPEKSTNSNDFPFKFSLKSNASAPAIVVVDDYEGGHGPTRDSSGIHNLVLNTAPTLGIKIGDSSILDDVTHENTKTILLSDIDSQVELTINKELAIISFDSDGGTPIYEPVMIKNYNEINLADYVPTKKGYSFDGWYSLNPDGTMGGTAPLSEFIEDELDVNSDTLFRAKWIKNKDHNNDSGKHVVVNTGVK